MILFMIIGLLITLPLLWRYAKRLIKRRKKMIYHYIEYFYEGEQENTRDYGPLDHLTGCGLLYMLEKNGGKVLFHRTGSLKEIENVIDAQYYRAQDEEIGEYLAKKYQERYPD